MVSMVPIKCENRRNQAQRGLSYRRKAYQLPQHISDEMSVVCPFIS